MEFTLWYWGNIFNNYYGHIGYLLYIMTTMKRNFLTLTMPTLQGCSCHRKTKIKVLVVLYLTLLVHSTSAQQGFKPDIPDEEETNWDRFDKEYGIAPKRDGVTGNPRGKAGKSGIVISDDEYLSENFTLSPGNRDSGIDICNFFKILVTTSIPIIL